MRLQRITSEYGKLKMFHVQNYGGIKKLFYQAANQHQISVALQGDHTDQEGFGRTLLVEIVFGDSSGVAAVMTAADHAEAAVGAPWRNSFVVDFPLVAAVKSSVAVAAAAAAGGILDPTSEQTAVHSAVVPGIRILKPDLDQAL